MNQEGLILIFIGVFILAAAIGNWNWFMNHRKARLIVKLLTRNGARYFYGFLGLCFLLGGLLAIMGIIEL